MLMTIEKMILKTAVYRLKKFEWIIKLQTTINQKSSKKSPAGFAGLRLTY
jgi:hypothetical protein